LRRIYLLEGREIPSSECGGFLHTHLKKTELECMACGEPILQGDHYIMLNVWNADPLHCDCFHYPTILGVKQYRKKTYYGIEKGYVDCVIFKSQEETKKRMKGQ